MNKLLYLKLNIRGVREKAEVHNISALLNFYDCSYNSRVDNRRKNAEIIIVDMGKLTEKELSNLGFKWIVKKGEI